MKSENSCHIHKRPLTFYLLGPDIFLTTRFSNMSRKWCGDILFAWKIEIASTEKHIYTYCIFRWSSRDISVMGDVHVAHSTVYSIFSLLSLFWKHRGKLMRLPCCLVVCNSPPPPQKQHCIFPSILKKNSTSSFWQSQFIRVFSFYWDEVKTLSTISWIKTSQKSDHRRNSHC
jgi:hypothetical protein